MKYIFPRRQIINLVAKQLSKRTSGVDPLHFRSTHTHTHAHAHTTHTHTQPQDEL